MLDCYFDIETFPFIISQTPREKYSK